MILGYISHVESALNIDIDFGIDEHLWAKYNLDKAIHNEYTYTEDDSLHVGVAHRTRLKGIAVRKDVTKKNKKIEAAALFEFKNAVNRCGGFVYYSIRGVDVFGRVIADIYDPLTHIRLNDIYLQPQYNLVFKAYTRT